jgi:hypothetical protein
MIEMKVHQGGGVGGGEGIGNKGKVRSGKARQNSQRKWDNFTSKERDRGRYFYMKYWEILHLLCH